MALPPHPPRELAPDLPGCLESRHHWTASRRRPRSTGGRVDSATSSSEADNLTGFSAPALSFRSRAPKNDRNFRGVASVIREERVSG